MKKIYNLILLSDNAGDKLASPLDYFKFPIETEKMDVSVGNVEKTRGQFIIYGGGGLIHLPAPNYNNGVMQYLEDICNFSPWLVSWGVGHNIHHSKEIEYPESFVKKFRLHGVRDRQPNLPWVPCVSCMSKLFHHNYKVEHNVVVAGHNLPRLDGLPTVELSKTPPKEVIEIIASGDTVVTNSYHGAYWGLLLNRKVVVFNPMSSKFYGLPEQVQLATPDTWKQSVSKAMPYKGFLALCRNVNKAYHKKVLTLVNEYTKGV